jgi:hypothetical protein
MTFFVYFCLSFKDYVLYVFLLKKKLNTRETFVVNTRANFVVNTKATRA